MISIHRYDAVLFDLDGVLTATASLHARCWKRVFDAVLSASGDPYPFDPHRDYLTYVDGKPREEGVRDFLRSRGIEADDRTIRDIGDAKQQMVERMLAREGVRPFPGSVRWVRALRRAGVGTAVVSSSANAVAVLEAARIDHLFDGTVDGRDLTALSLRGKPAPDAFLHAAERLRVTPDRAVVVEDAIAGVAAGRAGGFGLVVGVARGATPDALSAAGADLVVTDVGELAA